MPIGQSSPASNISVCITAAEDRIQEVCKLFPTDTKNDNVIPWLPRQSRNLQRQKEKTNQSLSTSVWNGINTAPTKQHTAQQAFSIVSGKSPYYAHFCKVFLQIQVLIRENILSILRRTEQRHGKQYEPPQNRAYHSHQKTIRYEWLQS